MIVVSSGLAKIQEETSWRHLNNTREQNIEWVHVLGVSVEIELKMNWQGCKQAYNCQILHLIGQWD